MKKHTKPAAIAVLIVLQIISLVRIGNLQNDLTSTRNQLSSLTSQQSSQISNIYANIDAALKRQASIIDSYEYSFGLPDKDKLTIPVTFKISPKETREDTGVALFVADKSITMKKEATNFTAAFPIGIFDAFEAKVIISDRGIQKTEKLEVSENLRERVLPTIAVHFEGESTSGYRKMQGKLSGVYQRTGNLNMDVKPAENNKIEGARLVVDLDGKIVSNKKIDQIGGSVIKVDEKVTISAGQKMTMAVIATDSLGLIHKIILDQYELDKNAEPAPPENGWLWPGEVIITDKDGTVLYAPQYEKLN